MRRYGARTLCRVVATLSRCLLSASEALNEERYEAACQEQHALARHRAGASATERRFTRREKDIRESDAGASGKSAARSARARQEEAPRRAAVERCRGVQAVPRAAGKYLSICVSFEAMRICCLPCAVMHAAVRLCYLATSSESFIWRCLPPSFQRGARCAQSELW